MHCRLDKRHYTVDGDSCKRAFSSLIFNANKLVGNPANVRLLETGSYMNDMRGSKELKRGAIIFVKPISEHIDKLKKIYIKKGK